MDRIEVADQLNLRWGDYSGLSVGMQCNKKCYYK